MRIRRFLYECNRFLGLPCVFSAHAETPFSVSAVCDVLRFLFWFKQMPVSYVKRKQSVAVWIFKTSRSTQVGRWWKSSARFSKVQTFFSSRNSETWSCFDPFLSHFWHLYTCRSLLPPAGQQVHCTVWKPTLPALSSLSSAAALQSLVLPPGSSSCQRNLMDILNSLPLKIKSQTAVLVL